MKRTPVLIDVNGVPASGEPQLHRGRCRILAGKWQEWLPPSQSADAALLPCVASGNARADDLVRNNGIAANAVALHKDHIVGHMFLISYRPNWALAGDAGRPRQKVLSMRWRRHGPEYAEGMFGGSTWKETHVYGIYP